MKKMAAVLMALMLLASTLVACGSGTSFPDESSKAETAPSKQEEGDASDNTEDEADRAPEDSEIDALNVIGEIEVENELFDVTITLPADLTGEMTPEEIAEFKEMPGIRSAALNDDGSMTLVMTEAAHRKMLEEYRAQIQQTLDEMCGSEEYPNIVSIEVNDNFTSFRVTTTSTELSFDEEFSVFAFYIYSGVYSVFSGDEVDNIHVEFVNSDTGDIIDSSDSKDLANS